MAYEYSSLLLDLAYGIIWFAFFFWRKDLRKEMLFISIPFGIIGLSFNIIYVQDWWNPLTITGTIPAIEDFLYGFFLGGIAAVAYEEIYGKRIKSRRESKSSKNRKEISFWLTTLGGIAAFYILYFLFKVNTLIISAAIMLFMVLFILFKRSDLILSSFISGILLVIISIPVYAVVELITPGWIDEFWYFNFFPRSIIAYVPLEDHLFYFLFGAAIGPLYEFWQESRLVDKK